MISFSLGVGAIPWVIMSEVWKKIEYQNFFHVFVLEIYYVYFWGTRFIALSHWWGWWVVAGGFIGLWTWKTESVIAVSIWNHIHTFGNSLPPYIIQHIDLLSAELEWLLLVNLFLSWWVEGTKNWNGITEVSCRRSNMGLPLTKTKI